MYYENLPIFRSSLNLVVYVETIVKSFEKYHKYTIGAQLREKAQAVLFLIAQANMAVQKHEKLYLLRDSCEQLKMMVQVAKELKAFKSFTQFEHTSKLCVEVCKQAQAWLKSTAGVLHASV